ncbi:MAG: hypothetical protein Q7T71_15075, partial [Herbiconiux sp.]|nr:hypothetical protein [Herbiconiux sp.]
IDRGSFAANQLRTFIEDNRIELSSLLNNVRTTGEILVKHLDGLQQVLVIYPYIVEAAFGVVSKSSGPGGKFDAHFGIVLSTEMPCLKGYETTVRRTPNERFTDPGMNTDARCTEKSPINARGSQNLPPRAGTAYTRPDAFFDPDTGKITYTDASDPAPVAPWESGSTVAPESLGKESWKWLYLEPMTGQ